MTGSTAAKPLLAEIGKLMAAQTPAGDHRLSRSGLVHRRRRDPVRDADRRLRQPARSATGTRAASSSSATSPPQRRRRARRNLRRVRDAPASSFRAASRAGGRHPRARAGDGLRHAQGVDRAGDQRRGRLLRLRFRRAVGGAPVDVRGADLPARRAVRHAAHDRRRHRRSGPNGGREPPRRRAAICSRAWATVNFPDQSIGILSAEVAQDNRATVKVLAYQHFGQSCAVFPDTQRDLERQDQRAQRPVPDLGAAAPFHPAERQRRSPTNAKAGEVDRLPGGHAPDAGGPRPDQARGAAPRDTPVRDAREAHAGDGADHAVCARRARAAATTKRSRTASPPASRARPPRSARRARRSAATGTARRSSARRASLTSGRGRSGRTRSPS